MTVAQILPILTALIGAVVGGFLTHILGSRRDIAIKRREIILPNLLLALDELEMANSSRPNSDIKKLEKVISRIILFGDADLVEKAKTITVDISKNGKVDTTPLYIGLRNAIRYELKLNQIPDQYIGLVIRYPTDRGFDEAKRTKLKQKSAE